MCLGYNSVKIPLKRGHLTQMLRTLLVAPVMFAIPYPRGVPLYNCYSDFFGSVVTLQNIVQYNNHGDAVMDNY